MAAHLVGSPRSTLVDQLIAAHAQKLASSPPVTQAPTPRPVTKADLRRELFETARSLGWRGKTRRSAMKFLAALERRERAARRATS